MKTNYLIISLLALGLALAGQHPIQAQQNVAVFKNGSAFFVRESTSSYLWHLVVDCRKQHH